MKQIWSGPNSLMGLGLFGPPSNVWNNWGSYRGFWEHGSKGIKFPRSREHGPEMSWEQGAACIFREQGAPYICTFWYFREQGAQYFMVNVWDNNIVLIKCYQFFYVVTNSLNLWAYESMDNQNVGICSNKDILGAEA